MPNRVLQLLLAASLLAGCASDQSGRIVFQSNRDGNFEIYVMEADGSNQRRITNSPSNDVTPSWSPDGSLILFASDRDGNWEIYIAAPDGSNPTRLTTPPGANTAPSWAYDGRKILFVSTRDVVNADLYLMNPDGSNVERLSADPSVKDTPIMTPNERAILFTANDKGRLALASYNLAAKEVRILTSHDCNSMNPSIAPDGEVVFSSDKDGNMDLYTMAVSGEHLRRITTSEESDRTPTWAHGTKAIIYAKKGGLYKLTLSSGLEQVLSSKGDIFPHWTSH